MRFVWDRDGTAPGADRSAFRHDMWVHAHELDVIDRDLLKQLQAEQAEKDRVKREQARWRGETV